MHQIEGPSLLTLEHQKLSSKLHGILLYDIKLSKILF